MDLVLAGDNECGKELNELQGRREAEGGGGGGGGDKNGVDVGQGGAGGGGGGEERGLDVG